MGNIERKSQRINAEYVGFLVVPTTNKMIRIATRDVSSGGLKAALEEPVSFGCRMLLNVVIGDYAVANLIVHPVWAKSDTFGFEIEQASSNWTELVGKLAAHDAGTGQ